MLEGVSELGARFEPWYGLTNMTSRDGRTVERWQQVLGRAIAIAPGESLTAAELSEAARAMREIADCLERDGGRPTKAALLHSRGTESERRIVQVLFWTCAACLLVRWIAGVSVPVVGVVADCLVFGSPLLYAVLLIRWSMAYRRDAERVGSRRCLSCGYPLEPGTGEMMWCSECGCANLPARGG